MPDLSDRRHFLKLLSGSSLAVGLFGHSSAQAAPKAKRPEESILIVGAGVSGLAAAEQLRKAGVHKITLIEARDRLGGRVHTSQAWKGTPVDLGASWIHGTRRNPITRLAEEAGVTMSLTDYENMNLYGSDGHPLTSDEEKNIDHLSRKLYRAMESIYGSNASSLHAVLSPSFTSLSPEDRAIMDFLIHSNIETDYAEDIDQLSPGADEFGKEFSGNDVLFPNGYFGVFESRYTPFDILLNHTVQKISRGPSGVTLHTNQGDLTADRVILTLPLGVLKQGHISFEPGLSKRKRDAMNTLGMGCLNKVYLRFPETFWPKDVHGFSYMGKQTGQWSDWLNLQAYQPEPVLLVFNSGSFGREIESWSDNDITEAAMKTLKQIFGKSIPTPNGAQITRWASDPFSLGSYSSLRPGSHRSTVKTLRASIDNHLFFAGEATSLDYPSTVHGAHLSGQRAAKELLAAM